MWKLLLLFPATFQLALAACPAGYDLVSEGQCRGHQASLPTTLFAQAASLAIKKCGEVQGQAVTIHNEEQQAYWKSKAPSTFNGFLVLGLVCNLNTKRWEWADGSALDFKPPSNLYNAALDDECMPEATWDIHPDGFWSYGNNGYVAVEIYCTTQLKTVPADDGCDSDDKVCYQIPAISSNWQDAQKICKKQGLNLASVHNSGENSFVRRAAVSSGAMSGVFLGASANGNEPFHWVDGSKMDYENYAQGFPKKNFGQCVAMDTSNSAGQWMNVDCNANLPFACMSKGPVAEPVCTDEEWKEGEAITSPGFPNSAYTPCDYFLTVPSGKKVRAEIALEANSCCDSLVLYDGYMGGSVIATLSGGIRNATYSTKTSNVMRVSWQPKGGVNVRGLAMTYHAV